MKSSLLRPFLGRVVYEIPPTHPLPGLSVVATGVDMKGEEKKLTI